MTTAFEPNIAALRIVSCVARIAASRIVARASENSKQFGFGRSTLVGTGQKLCSVWILIRSSSAAFRMPGQSENRIACPSSQTGKPSCRISFSIA